MPHAQADGAAEQRRVITARVDELLGGDAAVLLPSAPGAAPRLRTPPGVLDAFRRRLITLTSPAGLASLPQVCGRLPTGVNLGVRLARLPQVRGCLLGAGMWSYCTDCLACWDASIRCLLTLTVSVARPGCLMAPASCAMRIRPDRSGALCSWSVVSSRWQRTSLPCRVLACMSRRSCKCRVQTLDGCLLAIDCTTGRMAIWLLTGNSATSQHFLASCITTGAVSR